MPISFRILQFALVLILSLCMGSITGPVWAGAESADVRELEETAGEYPATSASAPIEVPVARPVSKPAVAPKPASDAQPKAQLAGSTWELTLNPMAAADTVKRKKGPLQDTLQFGEGGTIASQRLGGQGYPSSHYTVTVAGDGTITWETMQTSDKAGVVFWRGDIQGDTMQGVYSHRPVEGDASDYFFNGHKVATPPPAAVVAPPSAAASVAASAPVAVNATPVTQPPAAPAPAPRQRKKWW